MRPMKQYNTSLKKPIYNIPIPNLSSFAQIPSPNPPPNNISKICMVLISGLFAFQFYKKR